MALQVNTKFKGIAVNGAYVTVMIPSVSVDKKELSFGVWYRSAQENEVFDAVTFTSPYSMDGPNPFIQAYEYLKMQPSFQGCIDC